MVKYSQSNKNKFFSKNVMNSLSIFKVEYEKILRRVQTNEEKLKNIRKEFGNKMDDLNNTPNNNAGKQEKRRNVDRVRAKIRQYEGVIEGDFDILKEIRYINRLLKKSPAKITGAANINNVNKLESYYSSFI